MQLGNWLKPLFRLEEWINLFVSDVDGAAAWYREKLGCKSRQVTDEDEGDWDEVEAAEVCTFESDEIGIYLMKLVAGADDGTRSDRSSSIIHCKNLDKGAEFLSSRGVSVGAIQEDGDGSRFFNIEDLDGNNLQILEG
jgi:predicted enzyme related to lactoylglutathione lyase